MKLVISESQLKRIVEQSVVGASNYGATGGNSSSKANKTKSNENLPCNAENVWNEINKIGIKHPDIVLKQAQLESGHFGSNVFHKHNNIFGMMTPNDRPNVVNKNKSTRMYAHYDTWQDSVMDYKLWQDYWSIKKNGKRIPINTITDKCGYIDALDRLYCQTGTCDPKHPERNRPYSTLLLDMVKNLKCKFEKI